MSHDPLAPARALAKGIRFRGDIPVAEQPAGRTVDSALRSHFNQSDVMISDALTPGVRGALDSAFGSLGIPVDLIPAFVYGSADVQAECVSRTGGDCVIRFSSGLVDLLAEEELAFVAGHEVGHFLLGHVGEGRGEGTALEGQMMRRRQEISVDRIGLLACGSLDVALRALMKTASGLSSRHLRFDIGAFIGQLRNVEDGFTSGRSTHPSFVIRCRALLWFSMTGAFRSQGSELDGVELAEQDERIEADLVRWSDGMDAEQIRNAEHEVLLWTAAREIVASSSFRLEQQEQVAQLVGRDTMERLRAFLGDLGRDEATQVVGSRLDEAISWLAQLAPARALRFATDSDAKVRRLLTFAGPRGRGA